MDSKAEEEEEAEQEVKAMTKEVEEVVVMPNVMITLFIPNLIYIYLYVMVFF